MEIVFVIVGMEIWKKTNVLELLVILGKLNFSVDAFMDEEDVVVEVAIITKGELVGTVLVLLSEILGLPREEDSCCCCCCCCNCLRSTFFLILRLLFLFDPGAVSLSFCDISVRLSFCKHWGSCITEIK